MFCWQNQNIIIKRTELYKKEAQSPNVYMEWKCFLFYSIVDLSIIIMYSKITQLLLSNVENDGSIRNHWNHHQCAIYVPRHWTFCVRVCVCVYVGTHIRVSHWLCLTMYFGLYMKWPRLCTLRWNHQMVFKCFIHAFIRCIYIGLHGNSNE